MKGIKYALSKILAIVIAVVVVTVGVGVTLLLANISSTPPPEKPEVIRIADTSPYPPPYHTALFSAAEKLKAMGIKVEIPVLRGFEGETAALLAGEIDIGWFPLSSLAAMVKQGAPVKVVASYTQRDEFAFVTKAEVKTLSDLKGKKLAAHGRFSLTELALVAIMDSAGMKTGKDYELVYITGTPARASALAAGTIDGTVIGSVEAFALVRKDPRFKILAWSVDAYPRGDYSVWVVREDTLRNRPGVVYYFLKAYLEAVRELNSMTPEQVAQRYWSLLDTYRPEVKAGWVLEDVVNSMRKVQPLRIWDDNGGLTRDSWRVADEVYRKYGFYDTPLNYDAVVDRTTLDRVLSEIGRK
ncbi:MAG: ABC transporter substrate-binding protein [Nitrososphaerota archaeon]